MYGYINSDADNDPSIRLKTSALATDFFFRDYEGEGKIQVANGSDYNPFVLIETLFQHMTNLNELDDEISKFKKKKKDAPIQWDNTVTKFDKNFLADWE
ncbi:MAG: hypothetical protein CM15mV29_0740 [uncultured marine virus]|nr:MAG: hypothetical protein CM15mV29_0740 [uncultured marine virus]